MADKKPQLHLSKPADRSLQAFKDWMQAMGDKLMPGSPPDDATEEEWIADHKAFWEGLDSGLAKKEQNKKYIAFQVILFPSINITFPTKNPRLLDADFLL